MIHFISECICNDAQFHGTETVKRVDLVYYDCVCMVHGQCTQRFATERSDFTRQSHPHQQPVQQHRKGLYAATDEPYAHNAHKQSAPCKSRIFAI